MRGKRNSNRFRHPGLDPGSRAAIFTTIFGSRSLVKAGMTKKVNCRAKLTITGKW